MESSGTHLFRVITQKLGSRGKKADLKLTAKLGNVKESHTSYWVLKELRVYGEQIKLGTTEGQGRSLVKV